MILKVIRPFSILTIIIITIIFTRPKINHKTHMERLEKTQSLQPINSPFELYYYNASHMEWLTKLKNWNRNVKIQSSMKKTGG